MFTFEVEGNVNRLLLDGKRIIDMEFSYATTKEMRLKHEMIITELVYAANVARNKFLVRTFGN